MAKNTSSKVVDFVDKGTKFFKALGEAIGAANNLYSSYNKTNFSGFVKVNPKNKEKELVAASYRFMSLDRGCGKKAISKRFNEMIKEIRPDINLDELSRKKFTALRVAREYLLKIEN